MVLIWKVSAVVVSTFAAIFWTVDMEVISFCDPYTNFSCCGRPEMLAVENSEILLSYLTITLKE